MKKALIIGESEMIRQALFTRLEKTYYATTVDDMKTGLLMPFGTNHVYFTGGFWFGLMENEKRPADLGFQNAQIIMDVVNLFVKSEAEKMLFVSSSCIYPPSAPQPIKEDALMTGQLEPISEPSALARIWGHKLLTYYNKQYGTQFVTVEPTGMYGDGDDFCPATGHVLPALIERFTIAKEQGLKDVVLWGSGQPLREWVHVDDVADACAFAMENCNNELVNIANPEGELSIADLAVKIAGISGYKGEIKWDTTKPDGAFRKALDGSKLANLGWRPKISLQEGLERTIKWYQENPRV